MADPLRCPRMSLWLRTKQGKLIFVKPSSDVPGVAKGFSSVSQMNGRHVETASRSNGELYVSTLLYHKYLCQLSLAWRPTGHLCKSLQLPPQLMQLGAAPAVLQELPPSLKIVYADQQLIWETNPRKSHEVMASKMGIAELTIATFSAKIACYSHSFTFAFNFKAVDLYIICKKVTTAQNKSVVRLGAPNVGMHPKAPQDGTAGRAWTQTEIWGTAGTGLIQRREEEEEDEDEEKNEEENENKEPQTHNSSKAAGFWSRTLKTESAVTDSIPWPGAAAGCAHTAELAVTELLVSIAASTTEKPWLSPHPANLHMMEGSWERRGTKLKLTTIPTVEPMKQNVQNKAATTDQGADESEHSPQTKTYRKSSCKTGGLSKLRSYGASALLGMSSVNGHIRQGQRTEWVRSQILEEHPAEQNWQPLHKWLLGPGQTSRQTRSNRIRSGESVEDGQRGRRI
ncbi:hypothetical protein DV515_00000704, partial [Chloebia gouldiae]